MKKFIISLFVGLFGLVSFGYCGQVSCDKFGCTKSNTGNCCEIPSGVDFIFCNGGGTLNFVYEKTDNTFDTVGKECNGIVYSVNDFDRTVGQTVKYIGGYSSSVNAYYYTPFDVFGSSSVNNKITSSYYILAQHYLAVSSGCYSAYNSTAGSYLYVSGYLDNGVYTGGFKLGYQNLFCTDGVSLVYNSHTSNIQIVYYPYLSNFSSSSCPDCPSCPACPEIDTNYCVENGYCPNACGSGGDYSGDLQFSNLYINNILHPGQANIFVNIPDYITWDYTTTGDDFSIYVGSGYDMDYMNSIIKINSYRPDSGDFTNIFVSGLTLIFPYIFIALLIVFVWKLLKRIFK